MKITTTLTTETLNGKETIVKTFEGTIQHKGGLTHIAYEDAELGKTQLFITEDRVRLVRKGTFTTQMIFVPQATTYSDYHTPGGTFDLGINTTLFHVSTSENQGNIEIHYVLSISREVVAKNELTIVY